MNYLKTLKAALDKRDSKVNTAEEIIDTCELIHHIAWAMYIKSRHQPEWKMWEAIQCLVKGIEAKYKL